MNKTIASLEKENVVLKTRNDKCNRNLLAMAEEVCGHCKEGPGGV